MMLGYRSLKNATDSAEWWDNWAHNFVLSLLLWPLLIGILISVAALLTQ